MASDNYHSGEKTQHEHLDIKIIINEEYARLAPVISESEYKTIKHSIKQDGQHVPVIINQKGEILDGHTRFKACKEIGIAPRTMMREEFEDPLLEKQFIIDINRNRRHLNPFQRIELECKYETIESELAKKRMFAHKKVDPVSDEGQGVSVELSLSSNSSTDEDTLVKLYQGQDTVSSQRADREQKKKGLIDPVTGVCV